MISQSSSSPEKKVQRTETINTMPVPIAQDTLNMISKWDAGTFTFSPDFIPFLERIWNAPQPQQDLPYVISFVRKCNPSYSHLDILFPEGKAELTDVGMSQLITLAHYFRNSPSLRVILEINTENSGNDLYKQRVESVYNYMSAQEGVPTSQVEESYVNSLPTDKIRLIIMGLVL
jgi:outer membrane protein OmpA-like peptidoglycan-associated protein